MAARDTVAVAGDAGDPVKVSSTVESAEELPQGLHATSRPNPKMFLFAGPGGSDPFPLTEADRPDAETDLVAASLDAASCRVFSFRGSKAAVANIRGGGSTGEDPSDAAMLSLRTTLDRFLVGPP